MKEEFVLQSVKEILNRTRATGEEQWIGMGAHKEMLEVYKRKARGWRLAAYIMTATTALATGLLIGMKGF